MIKPCALQEGNRAAVIAPAGPPEQEHLKQGIRVLEDMGLEVVIGKHVYDGEDSDEKRLSDIHEAFCDPSIKAVFCANGGAGSAKLAPMIDYEIIQKNPKIFWGYSDITYLLHAIHNFSDMVTFHGPMVSSDLNDEQRSTETESSILPLLTGESYIYDSHKSPLMTLSHGTGEGRLVGGNLTLLTNGMGTPFQVNTKGAILLIEDVAEPAFRIDAMLTHLKQAGVFESVKGVILGHFQDDPEEYEKIKEVLKDFFSDAPYPVVENFYIGHCNPNYGVPLGVQAKLTTSPPQLIIESGVV
ncbi:S66 peptidase family protein [Halobacillus litoralis]|uniref:S66 peptidase family protein n=1 Tax=Halobacillus litoralis TaxID=45668 RepID=UPI001CFDF171|nr:LD-carboxypeptidase [Halobacillus litoralis]